MFVRPAPVRSPRAESGPIVLDLEPQDAVRLFTLSGADFLDEWFSDDRVKGALATQSIIGAWGGPMSPGSAYVLMHHWIGEVEGHPGAWGWVHGGMGSVSDALAASAKAAGGEIRPAAEVRRVVVRSASRWTTAR